MRAVILAGTLSTGLGDRALAAKAPPVERMVLDNGVVLLVIPQHDLPMVVVSALVDGGSRLDPDGKEGLASLTASLLPEGTAKRTAEEIHETVDFLGAKLSAAAGDDYSAVTLMTLEKDLPASLDLLVDVLRNPAFPKDEFGRKKEEALGGIEADEQDPGAIASREFRKKLFGKGPYRAPTAGWADSVKALTANDVAAFYRATYHPNRTIVVVSGDITPKAMLALANQLLGDWKAADAPLDGPPPKPLTQKDVVRIDRDLTQANLIWGHLGTTREDPDWYALQVMNYILGGGGFSSRMMSSIRTEAGLAYSVFSYFSGGKLPGSFQVTLQTKSASTREALDRLEREVARIREQPVSDDELSQAKKYLTGSFPMRFDSNGDMVSFYSQVEYFHLGLDYPERYEGLIESVTKDDIQRVATKYLHPEQAILVVVGDQEKIDLENAPGAAGGTKSADDKATKPANAAKTPDDKAAKSAKAADDETTTSGDAPKAAEDKPTKRP
ncbi:MAG: zinc protease [Candidatus Binatota bacterium]|nr:zinc protease [Candidatus Binatota bacterium]